MNALSVRSERTRTSFAPVVDYVSSGRDYDGLSLGGYRRASCYAAASATGSLSNHHHDSAGAGGRNSVGKSPSYDLLINR